MATGNHPSESLNMCIMMISTTTMMMTMTIMLCMVTSYRPQDSLKMRIMMISLTTMTMKILTIMLCMAIGHLSLREFEDEDNDDIYEDNDDDNVDNDDNVVYGHRPSVPPESV